MPHTDKIQSCYISGVPCTCFEAFMMDKFMHVFPVLLWSPPGSSGLTGQSSPLFNFDWRDVLSHSDVHFSNVQQTVASLSQNIYSVGSVWSIFITHIGTVTSCFVDLLTFSLVNRTHTGVLSYSGLLDLICLGWMSRAVFHFTHLFIHSPLPTWYALRRSYCREQ